MKQKGSGARQSEREEEKIARGSKAEREGGKNRDLDQRDDKRQGYREEREECKDRDEAPDAEQGIREVQRQLESREGGIKTQG